MQSSLSPNGGCVIWFRRKNTMPETFGLDAAVVASGLTGLSADAVITGLTFAPDGAVHGLVLKESPSKVEAIALNLRERAARHGVAAMIRPWPDDARASALSAGAERLTQAHQDMPPC
ncbi:hypothetical protein [Azospirillum canadense]|uniref:hypothetical protein n=1 Tax=Azospirillum canadense TaxID=403962 RepID=UPI00222617B1|nr:hypothetical protein [Azospirillum canadense]MCW2240670.1 hypothetical protein [Azospirillum canadense]